MKKSTLLIFTFIFFMCSNIFSQEQTYAPWTNKSKLKTNKKLTIDQITANAREYFKTIDVHKKGSGLKPFERWKYHWGFYTNSDGTIKEASELWDAWEEKNALNRSKDNNDVSDWKPLGPYTNSNTYNAIDFKQTGQGRVNVIAVDPNNPNTIYVGAPAGGLWKSRDGGSSWSPLTDHLPQIGVSGIAIDPKNSNIIYIATGDDDNGDSYAVGVWKSIDGGTTWNNTGTIPGNPQSMNEIYVFPNNSQHVIVATRSGIQKSTDGGNTWTTKQFGNIIDLKMKPNNPSIWYAVSKTSFYKSTNSGESFTKVNINSLTDSGRLTIDVTPANSNYVYILSSKTDDSFNGVYKSTNSGASFSRTSEYDDIFGSSQAWYDLALTVSSKNPNIVYVGVLDIWKSTDGGNNFSKLNLWYNPNTPNYTHADIHFMRFINNKLYAGTDGGIYVSSDEGASFTDLTKNIAISQFYKISVSKQNSSILTGGLQDNGGFSFENETWRNYHGGDGMEGLINPNDPNTHYGFIQYGGRLYISSDSGKSNNGYISAPAAEVNKATKDSGGEWVTPMAINSKGDLYAGYKQLYKLDGSSWVKVSKNVFFGGGDIDHIQIDPINENNIYLAQGNGLYKSSNGGVDFVELNTPSFENINDIEISSSNSNTGWYTTNSQVFKSVNLNSTLPTFTDITGNLPNDHKISIKHHKKSGNNTIYLGTSLGVYYINDSTTRWQTFDNNLPNVAIKDIEIHENDAKIIVATYGRGIFYSSVPEIKPNNDIQLVSINNILNGSISCSSDVSPEITVKNKGIQTINSITIKYKYDNNTSKVFNWNGSIASNDTKTISLPIENTTYGNHILNIETLITNDTYDDNNEIKKKFIINRQTSTPTTINSFENPSDNLQTTSSNNSTVWEIATPNKINLNKTATGTKAYVTKASGNYLDKNTSYLYTNCYNLSQITSPIFSFSMAFDIENDYDYLIVEYSKDQGNNWSKLGSASDPNWYNSFSTNNSLVGGQWTGNADGFNPQGGVNSDMHTYSYNLVNLANEKNVIFRFKFVTDEATNQEGIVIDDIVINGTLSTNDAELQNSFIVHPNPSSGSFNFTWAGEDKSTTVSVYDYTGRLVFKKKNINNNTYNLDLNSLSKGIYVAKLTTNKKTATKKLILK